MAVYERHCYHPDLHQQPSDLNSAVTTYNSAVPCLLNKHAPIKKRIITIRPDTKWYTAELNQAKNHRRATERKWRETRLEIHHQIYKDTCRHVNKLIRETKCSYYTNLIKECANDQSKLFRIISTLFSQYIALPTHTSTHELTKRFSQYFTTNIKDIRTNLDTTDISTQFTNLEIHTASTLPSFTSANPLDIRKLIMKSPNKSCLLDPLPTPLLKPCLDSLLPYISMTINLSLQSGKCQHYSSLQSSLHYLRRHHLITIHSRTIVLSPTCRFSPKVLERIVASQLTDYLTANSLLEPLQSAYKKYHSTETALLKIHNDICSFIDSGNYVLLCLLDLSAAFDTIDHNILLNRMSNLGVTDMALQ
ncbi:uncharacterized protein LOC100368499 [Saccoglossus kowalevskii]|uniref:Uncharacterized protein LOC100368499 n=1 Tax=Saccoglossus kowalevskii TaxID=10224 RepID=A0ABM0MTA4_SACKO|nr:PREDICTED: uncharacterized protein LOC100368499 [Saccoglossus kowalevskii]